MKFCIICGGLLFQNSDGMECSTCGRIYSGLLISESAEENEDFVTTELSVSIESIITREPKSPERLEVQVETPKEKREALLEELLKYAENIEERKKKVGEYSYDVNKLRKELDLWQR